MDFDDTPEEAAFRAEARAWLRAHAPEKSSTGGQQSSAYADPTREAEHVQRSKEWQATLYDGGWAGITWPKEYGGRGGSAIQQIIFNQELAHIDVPGSIFAQGIGMAGPTVMAHGSDAQRDRFLGPMLRGDEVWCQLFSEPGAGSDLAGLSTRAVRDGDEFVVDGQKVWNSSAHYADWGILLARTDPDAPKHRGISYFLVDMRTPGIDVRPLRQITGAAHFNEVFLTGVRIPAENVVGPLNGGWGVAVTTLANERTLIGGAGASRGERFDGLVQLARRNGLADNACFRQRLADTYVKTRVIAFLGSRVQSALSRGAQPGPESSVLKLLVSQQEGEVGDLAMALLGASGTLFHYDDPVDDQWQMQFLNQWGSKIGGGTAEVQRNIIGERVLGLPAEPRADKNIPFRANA